MTKWIGPRRAMLLIALALIGTGWYYRDYQIELFGEPGSVGGLIIVFGCAVIGTTIAVSIMNNC
jgi:hypothetical protein